TVQDPLMVTMLWTT
nr:immunoglobulin heavy chain junction region [Mus musculus]